jgi:hypothetical protein
MSKMASEAVRDSAAGPDVVALVSGIWEQVLGVSNIGLQDDFFALGGTSMLLIAMVDAVQEQTKKEVEMGKLSEGITIQRIAELLA